MVGSIRISILFLFLVVLPEDVLDFRIEGRNPAVEIDQGLICLEGRNTGFFAVDGLLGLGRTM
jgi:hypothetical protein